MSYAAFERKFEPEADQARPAKVDDHAVLELHDFEHSFPADTPFFAVCTGPYRIIFRQSKCSSCGAASLVRQYQVKVAALASLEVPELDDLERAELGQMDSVAQSIFVINAKTWVTSRDPSAYISLATIHSALPKWVLESTAMIINDYSVITSESFSKVSFAKSAIGRKTMVHACPACQNTLPDYKDCDASAERHQHALVDQSGQPLLYTWPVIVSELAQA